jgi:hypothetical protein
MFVVLSDSGCVLAYILKYDTFERVEVLSSLFIHKSCFLFIAYLINGSFVSVLKSKKKTGC